MTGDLHQISVEIGRLQQHAEEARTNTEAVWRKLEDIGDKLSPLPALVADMRTVKDKVESHERWKNRVLGMAAVVSAGAGAVASTVAAKLGWR